MGSILLEFMVDLAILILLKVLKFLVRLSQMFVVFWKLMNITSLLMRLTSNFYIMQRDF